MIFNNYSIRYYVYKFLSNNISVNEWGKLGSISYWLSSENHNVTDMSYLFSDQSYFISNMTRQEFHFIADTFPLHYESDETSLNDKYVPKYAIVHTHNNVSKKVMDGLIEDIDNSSFSILKQECAGFDEDISTWNTNKVLSMEGTFYGATSFNQNINKWNTSKVTSMKNMFNGANSYNNPMNDLDTSKVITMEGMFMGATSFNFDISNFVMDNVISTKYMFKNATRFDVEIRNWEFPSIDDGLFTESTHDMFEMASEFIKKYKTQEGFSVTPLLSFWKSWPVTLHSREKSDSNYTYEGDIHVAVEKYLCDETHETAVTCYGNIKNWNVSGVTNMKNLFKGRELFNEDLSNWNVSNVTNMDSLFYRCSLFNSNISSWNTKSCKNMSRMFYKADCFNCNIEDWDVQEVLSMEYMFKYALSFQYSVRNWKVKDSCNVYNMFNSATQYYKVNKEECNELVDYCGNPLRNKFFSYKKIEESNVRIPCFPGCNLIGFSLPGRVVVDRNITLYTKNTYGGNILDSTGGISESENILMPYMINNETNLKQGYYNNVPIISSSRRGRYGSVNIIISDDNKISSITVSNKGQEYEYKDSWYLDLDISKLKKHCKDDENNIKKIHFKEIGEDFIEVDHTYLDNDKKEYIIDSECVSKWVNVPMKLGALFIQYYYCGSIPQNHKVKLRKGTNNVGFTCRGQMNLLGGNFLVKKINCDNSYLKVILRSNNFISKGIHSITSNSISGDIGKLYGCMEGQVKNVPIISRTGKGRGAIINLSIKDNCIEELTFVNVGTNYSIGDGLEIKYGIKFTCELSRDEEIEPGCIHIDRLRKKLTSSLMSSQYCFTPGNYSNVPFTIRKSLKETNRTNGNTHHKIEKNKMSCAIKDKSNVLYFDLIISEKEVESLSLSTNNEHVTSLESLSVGDEVIVNHGVFKSFFLTHGSVFQSSKGLNPSSDNLLLQIEDAMRLNNYRIPEGTYNDIIIETISGKGRGASVDMKVNEKGKVESICVKKIGFGYEVSDIICVPIMKYVNTQSDKGEVSILVKDNINVVTVNCPYDNSYTTQSLYQGFIVECDRDDCEMIFTANRRLIYRHIEGSRNYILNLSIANYDKGTGEYMITIQLSMSEDEIKQINELHIKDVENSIIFLTVKVNDEAKYINDERCGILSILGTGTKCCTMVTSSAHCNILNNILFDRLRKSSLFKVELHKADNLSLIEENIISEDSSIQTTVLTLNKGKESFSIQGPPINSNCLVVGGGGAGGKIDMDNLNIGGRGGNAGSVTQGYLTLQEGETYEISVGEGGKSNSNSSKDGEDTILKVRNNQLEKHYSCFPGFMKEEDLHTEFRVISIGGKSGDFKGKGTTPKCKKEEIFVGGNKMLCRNSRETQDEEDNKSKYRGGYGGGGVLADGTIGEDSDLSSTMKKGKGGKGGNGVYWSGNNKYYGGGGSGAPNWGKPWQKISPHTLDNERRRYIAQKEKLMYNEKQLDVINDKKLKQSLNSVEANEIVRISKIECDTLKSQNIMDLSQECLFFNKDMKLSSHLSGVSLGGGGGVDENNFALLHGEENSGGGGSAGYWAQGTQYPKTQTVINSDVVEPGNGGSGTIIFSFDSEVNETKRIKNFFFLNRMDKNSIVAVSEYA